MSTCQRDVGSRPIAQHRKRLPRRGDLGEPMMRHPASRWTSVRMQSVATASSGPDTAHFGANCPEPSLPRTWPRETRDPLPSTRPLPTIPTMSAQGSSPTRGHQDCAPQMHVQKGRSAYIIAGSQNSSNRCRLMPSRELSGPTYLRTYVGYSATKWRTTPVGRSIREFSQS
jgi:hypothetical protein